MTHMNLLECKTPDAITIGTEYIDRKGRICVVIDIWLTYNSAGECVKTRYVTMHQFMGQSVTEHDVLAITIQKSRIFRPAA